MRIVVTGGAGFIGSAVSRKLVAECGATVLNLDKLTATSSLASLAPVSRSPRYSFRRADVCDRERMSALLQAFSPDAIVHAAFERQWGADATSSQATIETNVLGTWRMLDAARDYWSTLPFHRQEKFRFLSVSSVAGRDTAATASRSGADDLVSAWHKSYGLPTIVSKAVDTFGPYQFTGHPVASAVIAAIDGDDDREKTCEPHTGELSDWLYVEDHVAALLSMLAKGTPGATYSVAGRGRMNRAVMCARVHQLVARHGGRSGAALRLASQSIVEAAALVAGTEQTITARLAHDTGWSADTAAEQALSQTVRWYLANEAWWRPLQAAAAATGDFGLLRIA
jgi:dTDP-glucose 4,6-dehydratase